MMPRLAAMRALAAWFALAATLTMGTEVRAQADRIETCGTAPNAAIVPSCANTYFSSAEERSQVSPGVFLSTRLGGMVATAAFYPDAFRREAQRGLDEFLIGTNGTFEIPKPNRALSYRSVLYASSGANALKAFYTDAIREFTDKLNLILAAEEQFRTALQLNPLHQQALEGLLEAYYARAEGFMLIGNEYMTRAYRHKFQRSQLETRSIVDLEIGDIDSALTSYETGFREFMKLFNREYIGVDEVRKPHLELDAERLFFERRYPGGSAGLVSFEALRGQKAAIGAATRVRAAGGQEIQPIQGSPSLSVAFSSTQSGQIATLVAPVKFTVPKIEGTPSFMRGTEFTIRFEADTGAGTTAKYFDLLVEFDSEKLIPPTQVSGVSFKTSITGSPQLLSPGSVYNDNLLRGNQLVLRFETEAGISGQGRPLVSMTFRIRNDAPEPVDPNVYIVGSGGQLLSGFKDIALLYRLAAAHANAAGEKVVRLYERVEPEESAALIDAEIRTIGGWFEHIQTLLEQSASSQDLEQNDTLQDAVARVSAELNNLAVLRGSLRSGANVFGYADDYVPFYDDGVTNTVEAVKSLVAGAGSFSAASASGFFGTARDEETNAIEVYGQLQDTRDRIRNEIFTANEEAESRLVALVGRVDEQTGQPGAFPDPIDFDMWASPRNLACEVGQSVALLERARTQLEQASADVEALLKNIATAKAALQATLQIFDDQRRVIAEYSLLQAKLDRKIAEIVAEQTRLNAITQAFNTVAQGTSGFTDWVDGGRAYGAYAAAAATLVNGHRQARLEEKKGDLQASKTELAAQERISLAEKDSLIYEIAQKTEIERMLNDVIVRNIAAQIAEIDVQIALGQLTRMIGERDELLARRGRVIANLGEMSFADPTFRLTQFDAVREAELRLEFLKRWLYVLTRSVLYKWALPDDYVIRTAGLPDVRISDIQRIQVIGAITSGRSGTALRDSLTAAQYLGSILAFDATAPTRMLLSKVELNEGTDTSTRFSIREDWLRIVRTDGSLAETLRIRNAFRDWILSPERLDDAGNLVIEFNTLAHLENYDEPVNASTDKVWRHFALRNFATKPLWNNKITHVGVALKAFGLAFRPGTSFVRGSIEYGQSGFLKGNSDSAVDFRVYQMRQWRDRGQDGFEPVDFRIVPLTIPSAEAFQASYLKSDLKERPVAASAWRLIILASELQRIELANIEDIFVHIHSDAYQRQ